MRASQTKNKEWSARFPKNTADVAENNTLTELFTALCKPPYQHYAGTKIHFKINQK